MKANLHDLKRTKSVPKFPKSGNPLFLALKELIEGQLSTRVPYLYKNPFKTPSTSEFVQFPLKISGFFTLYNVITKGITNELAM